VVSRHHDVQLLPAARSQKTEATSSVLFALESVAPGRATGGAILGSQKKAARGPRPRRGRGRSRPSMGWGECGRLRQGLTAAAGLAPLPRQANSQHRAFPVNLSATRPVRLARWRQYTLTTGEKLSWSREHGGMNPNDSNSRKYTSARSRTVSPFRDNIGTGPLAEHRLMLNDCDRSRDQWLCFGIER